MEQREVIASIHGQLALVNDLCDFLRTRGAI
jgi:hypothetical protein